MGANNNRSDGVTDLCSHEEPSELQGENSNCTRIALEKALREKEERLQRILEGAVGGIWEWDIINKRVLYSDRWKRLHGYVETELSDSEEHWSAGIHPQDYPSVRAALDAHFLGQNEDYEAEYRVLLKDGTYKWIQDRGRATFNAAGQAIYMSGSEVDITRRKEVENERDRVFNLMGRAQTLAHLGYWTLDASLEQLYWSDEAKQIFGEPQQHVGTAAEELFLLVHPEDREEASAAYHNSVAEAEKSHEIEHRILHQRTGDIRIVKQRWENEFDSNGRLIWSLGIVQDITDLRRTETMVRESDERYRTSFEQSASVKLIIDPDTGMICEANDAAIDFYGYPRDEITKMSISQINVLNTEAVFAEMDSAIRSNKRTFRFKHQLSSGQVRDVEVFSSPILANGKTFLHSIIVDISESVLATDKIKANLELNAISAKVGLSELIQSALDIAERKTESLIGFFHFVEPNQESLVLQNWSTRTKQEFCRVEAQGVHYSLDQAGVWADCVRERHPVVHNDFQALPNRKGMPPGHASICREVAVPIIENGIIVAVIGLGNKLRNYEARDVSFLDDFGHNIWKTVKNKRQAQEISDAKEQLQAILRAAPDMVLSLDSNLCIEFVNHLPDGSDAPDLIGKNVIDLLPAKNRQTILSGMEKVFLTGEEFGHILEIESNVGEPRMYEIGATPVYLNHEIKSAIVCARDISKSLTLKRTLETALITVEALRKAQDELKESNIMLEAMREIEREANRDKGMFLATMSHELRTPLGAILAMTEGLLEELRGPLNGAQKKGLQLVLEATNHLVALVNNILDLSKMDNGSLELQKEFIPIKDLIEAGLILVRAQAEKKDISLCMRVSSECKSVFADSVRIRQVMTNLLSNAVKFTDVGGRVTVEAKPSHDKRVLQLNVRDTGIGIAKNNLESIFKPFAQIPGAPSSKVSGTGLGLSVSKRLIQAHGGHLEVKSQVGKGSCFSVFLPWSPDSQEDSLQIQPTPVALPLAFSAHILLVDDNESNLVAYGDYLKHRGYHIELARSGKEALHKIETCRPGLVLMDVQMPGMDGFETTTLIRESPELQDLPVILLTALTFPSIRRLGATSGANECLQRPIPMQDLVAVIESHLKDRKEVGKHGNEQDSDY